MGGILGERAVRWAMIAVRDWRRREGSVARILVGGLERQELFDHRVDADDGTSI